MSRLTQMLVALVAVAVAVSVELPEPGELALALNEDEFEDYLDAWLKTQASKQHSILSSISGKGCAIRVNGDLGQPQPVYLYNDKYLEPTNNTGIIHLSAGAKVTVACTGSKRVIHHPNIATSVATATAVCVKGTLFSGTGWLKGLGEFGELTCSTHSSPHVEATDETCYNNNLVIRVGFTVDNVFYPLFWSCFDQNRLEVLYAWYEQNPWNAVNQVDVVRPNWQAGPFFFGVHINTMYTVSQQKKTLRNLFGEDLADKYISGNQYLARGHLAAKTDFIFATGQRSTFYFINAAPQWQTINAGNWNWLEQNLRTRIGVAGYTTTVYTGTFGVSQLRDENDRLVDVYLHRDVNNNPQIPIPLYYYKVAYDACLGIGTAFVTINNPFYTEDEVRALTFCPDQCRNNSAFDWLRWQPDRIDIGYSFCCTIADFRKTVPHLPVFNVSGLLL